ncbi:MAG: hypothetical protein ABR968_12240, partial [Bacteroidales bacterium]
MRKLFTFICVAFMPLLMNSVFAQDTLIAWTFPSTSADSLADAGVAALSYSTRYISCQYGHANGRIPISYTATGAGGGSDKCAMATGWTNDPDSANWMVKFKTTGYSNLMVYSKQLSDGTNPGPRDFKVQYKLPGASSPWIDLGTTVTCANDWTTGVVNGVSLPATCDNQSSQVGVRWMVNSQLDINGNALLSTGISEIDDIVITGTSTVGINETGSENIIKV